MAEHYQNILSQEPNEFLLRKPLSNAKACLYLAGGFSVATAAFLVPAIENGSEWYVGAISCGLLAARFTKGCYENLQTIDAVVNKPKK